MNTFASDALNGLSPYELVFVRCSHDLTKLRIPDIGNTSKTVKEYCNILKERAQLIDALYLIWKTSEALAITMKSTQYKNLEIYKEGTLVYLLAPYASSLQSGTTKFRQDSIGPLVVKTRLDTTHYTLCDLIGQTLRV